jgi:protein transport protein SEC24
VLYQSILPRLGAGGLPGQHSPPEDTLYETDKEKNLYKPRDPIWTEIGQECAVEGIGVSIFLGNSEFVDIGSIGRIQNQKIKRLAESG